jgi:L,D-transpeptidase YcbB
MAQNQAFPHRIAHSVVLFAAAAALGCSAIATAQQTDEQDQIRIATEQIRYAGDAGDLAAAGAVAEFYERRDFLPAWREEERINDLTRAVRDAYDDGLNPADYHLQRIEAELGSVRGGHQASATEWAAFELVLSDALVSLVYHQRYGKADPLSQHASWNFRDAAHLPEILEVVEQAMSAPSLAGFLSEQFRRNSLYRRLRASLAAYRQIAADGGWPQISDGPTLRHGMTDQRVAILAARLAVTGELDAAARDAEPEHFDDALREAVRRFQSRHALETDGVVGAATLRALNVPVEARVQQLRLTLERARWVLDDLGSSFVVVNIAGFRAYVVADRRIVWETRVVVGREHRQTPVFRDEFKYIVFNPTWTVPYSIATREMLPQIKANADWFRERDFEVKDRTGSLIDPSTVDWSIVTPRNFDYSFVQRPGRANALGQVKFIFPNEHAVYLHDTPARELFSTAERAFSHGCIRVENPLELAEILLRENRWTRERIDAAVASGRTITVFLERPVPVLLLYWTASVDPDGTVHFYRDVYDRDPPVAEALDGPFRIR